MKLELILRLLGRSEEPQELEQLRLELVHKLEKLPKRAGCKRGAERFLEQLLDRINADSIDGCWEWARGTFTPKRRYGMTWWCGGKLVHRLMKEIIHEPPSDKHSFACHKCNNTKCVNPSHIYWGDAKSNSADCKSAGRLVREVGRERYNAKLTEEQVLRIIQEAPTRSRGWGRKIAAEFGVANTAINNIIRGRRWKHLTGGIKM